MENYNSPSTPPTLSPTKHTITHHHPFHHPHPTTPHHQPHHTPSPINQPHHYPPHPHQHTTNPPPPPTQTPPLIKLANFCRCGNFIKKLNFVSTPWKIIIPLENSVGGPYMGYITPSEWVMIFIFYAKVSFFENLVKKLDSGWSS